MNHQGTVGKSRVYIILCSALSFIVGGAVVYLTTGAAPSAPIVVSTPAPTPTAHPTPTPAPIRVYVSGAVLQPDVYDLPLGSIVKDAIEAAAGPTDDADLNRINLALGLRDQQQVYVPRQGEVGSPPETGGGGAAGALVNINTATAAELETLPRIGPSTAQKIVDYREANGPFGTAEDIKSVPGIGEATFEGLKDKITVGP